MDTTKALLTSFFKQGWKLPPVEEIDFAKVAG